MFCKDIILETIATVHLNTFETAVFQIAVLNMLLMKGLPIGMFSACRGVEGKAG